MMSLTSDVLELYLNDVYEKECLFEIDKEEMDFVQNGIETIVHKIGSKILQYGSSTDDSDIEKKHFRKNLMRIFRCLFQVEEK